MTSQAPSLAIRRVLGTMMLLALLTMMALPASAAPSVPPPRIGYLEITDVRDTSFFISWVTDLPSDGTANCYDASNTNLVQTATDDATGVTTHFVPIQGFSPSTTYRCEVVSGGVVDDNGGARYPVTTGPTLLIPGSATVDGDVYKVDGATLVDYALLYLRLIDSDGLGSTGSSQWAVARVEGGYWQLNLGNIRTADASAYFTYTPGTDQLEYWVQGGADGTWGRTIETTIVIPGTLPAQLGDATLDGTPLPFAVTLNSFSATGQTNSILVTWDTASEIDTLGFNLYRATDSAAPQDLLVFVPSQAPGSTVGAAYSYEDLDVQVGQTYFYWLEDVDLAGATTLHGPVSATVQTPTAVTLSSVSASPSAGAVSLVGALLALLAPLAGATWAQRRRP